MRNRLLPLILVAVVFIGIAIGLYISRTQTEPGNSYGDTVTDAATLENRDANGESLEGEGDAQDEFVDDAVPNPDLTTNENGLSKATAVLVTEKGTIRFKFYPQDAPKTVSRIIELINQDFYNGLTFHRVVPGFVVQGGDPTGTGTGGSGEKLEAEFNSRRHLEGSVAMARASDPNSADSQFYITMGPQPHLDRQYTVFGQTIEGIDVVKKIQPGDKILRAYIDNNG